jgi:hypothetical protein
VTVTETPIDFVGQRGLSLRKSNNKGNWHNTWHYQNKLKTETDASKYTEKLMMHFEAREDEGNNFVGLYRGWFTPPADARYRFHQSCNDHCNLNLGNTPG